MTLAVDSDYDRIPRRGRCSRCAKQTIALYRLGNDEFVGLCCVAGAFRKADETTLDVGLRNILSSVGITLDDDLAAARARALEDEERDYRKAEAHHEIWHAAAAFYDVGCEFCTR